MAKATTEIDPLHELLLAMSREQTCAGVLERIVQGLAARPKVALARIWLLRPGDVCQVCPLKDECPDRTTCLHLVASAGDPREDGADWSRLDGPFRRFPVGVRKVGSIAATREPLTLEVCKGSEWIVRPDWVQAEGIRGFAGVPLIHDEGILGVLAVFTRQRQPADRLPWLRLVADHAAAAIANARAFDEIKRLRRELEQERDYLREEVREAQAYGELIGRSPPLAGLIRQIELVAPTDASVLILGESGTGKELVAREIHRRSQRSERTLVKVNCASVPRDLFESEFFGHVRGAFTGAIKDRAGRFALADGGTLFLDEVGEIPLELQGKLLRVLQEGEYERVGEERTQTVDVRLITATNRDLKAEVTAGRFREDLYYRLNVFPLEVVPLRARVDDVPLLAAHFLERSARRLGRAGLRLTAGNVRALRAHAWPGNVRELQSVIERAAILTPKGGLRLDLSAPPRARRRTPESPEELETEVVPEAEMKRRELENLVNALRQSGGKVSGPGGAADLLGVKPTTLASRLKKLGLRGPRG